MTGDNWKTLRVPPEAYDVAKAQKEAEDRTWGEQIVRPGERDGDEPVADALTRDELLEVLREELDTDAPSYGDIQAAIRTIEERTGRIERQMEEFGGGR